MVAKVVWVRIFGCDWFRSIWFYLLGIKSDVFILYKVPSFFVTKEVVVFIRVSKSSFFLKIMCLIRRSVLRDMVFVSFVLNSG